MISELENNGEDCWDGCNQLQGKCDWCGSCGYCCRIGKYCFYLVQDFITRRQSAESVFLIQGTLYKSY